MSRSQSEGDRTRNKRFTYDVSANELIVGDRVDMRLVAETFEQLGEQKQLMYLGDVSEKPKTKLVRITVVEGRSDIHYARVTEVRFSSKDKSHPSEHIVKFEDVRGERHTARIEAGLPGDEHNKYVRLCEYIGVNPKNPAELRKEIIPVINSNDEIKIDYPPIQNQLNCRLRRGCSRLAENIRSRERAEESLLAIGIWLISVGGVCASIYII